MNGAKNTGLPQRILKILGFNWWEIALDINLLGAFLFI